MSRAIIILGYVIKRSNKLWRYDWFNKIELTVRSQLDSIYKNDNHIYMRVTCARLYKQVLDLSQDFLYFANNEFGNNEKAICPPGEGIVPPAFQAGYALTSRNLLM